MNGQLQPIGRRGKTKAGKVVVLTDHEDPKQRVEVKEEDRSPWIRQYIGTRYEKLPIVEDAPVAEKEKTPSSNKDDDELIKNTAKLIYENNVVSWF